jgi:hypothetical protein
MERLSRRREVLIPGEITLASSRLSLGAPRNSANLCTSMSVPPWAASTPIPIRFPDASGIAFNFPWLFRRTRAIARSLSPGIG